MASCTQIVRHLIAMGTTERAEYFALTLDFLRRKTGKPVESLYEFATAPATDEMPDWLRDQLLAAIARAVRERDQSALQS